MCAVVNPTAPKASANVMFSYVQKSKLTGVPESPKAHLHRSPRALGQNTLLFSGIETPMRALKV